MYLNRTVLYLQLKWNTLPGGQVFNRETKQVKFPRVRAFKDHQLTNHLGGDSETNSKLWSHLDEDDDSIAPTDSSELTNQLFALPKRFAVKISLTYKRSRCGGLFQQISN